MGHFKHLTPLRHISCVQKWLIWFYVVSLWIGSLIMVHCGLKHVGLIHNCSLTNKCTIY
jgi:hypothetical protein